MSEPAAEARSGRVIVESVLHPGRTRSVDAAMYHAARDTVLEVLPDTAPGLTLDEARAAILPHLPEDLFPGGAKSGWWFKTVQMDLEAKGVIAREKVRPFRIHRVARTDGRHT